MILEGKLDLENKETLPAGYYKQIRISDLPKEFFEKIREYKRNVVGEEYYGIIPDEIKKYYAMSIRGYTETAIIDVILESEFFD